MTHLDYWMRHTAGVPKGLLRYGVMELLSIKPMSGLEIMNEIEERTEWRPSPGSIYPLLSWLQRKGFLEKILTEEVVESAKRVGAHEFVQRLPEGYNTVIEESSVNISIGQRQLISFARAILANPRILILDEATSSVDPYTELIIQESLKKLLKNRTAFIIAHRLFTVRNADKILVINHGKILEEGTYSELMIKNGLYSQLYRMQFKEVEAYEPSLSDFAKRGCG